MNMFYKQPAHRWFDALPLGNGRIGAMVHGRADKERIELTETTFYSGEGAESNCKPGSPEAFQAGRTAAMAGDFVESERLLEGAVGVRKNYGSNLPFGNLRIATGHKDVEGFKRSLDLENAVAAVEYRCNGVQFNRRMYCSQPDQVMVVECSADQQASLNLSITLDGGQNPYSVEFDGSEMQMSTHAFEAKHSDGKTGTFGFARLRVVAEGGSVQCNDGAIEVASADRVLLYIAISCDFFGGDPQSVTARQLEAALQQDESALFKKHCADFKELFNRLNFGFEKEESALPTDERMLAVKNGGFDAGLIALQYQYGRYLIISSSREDSPLPSHLQGIWNDNEACRIGWTCDMHLDINTEMNYWAADLTGIAECGKPLYHWIENALVPAGRKAAAEAYGMPGWVAHTVSNPWGYAAPGWSMYWAFHVTAGAWIASHLWEHYRFCGDLEFLRDHAYPILKEAATFFQAYLLEDPESSELLSGPSCSPENNFYAGDTTATNCMAPACDGVFIRALFNSCIDAAKELDCEDDQTAALAEAVTKLPPLAIGEHEQIMEWRDELVEATPNHRHTTHLMALYPFDEITPETKELADAARTTIKLRMSADEPWEDTGWARSNLLCYAARLRDAKAAHESVQGYFETLAENNLLIIHPGGTAGAPNPVFEVDGNTGFTAGVTEMLLHSHEDCIRLLPALPATWPDGQISGLCARGGFVVDMSWKAGKLDCVNVRSTHGDTTCSLQYGQATVECDCTQPVELKASDFA